MSNHQADASAIVSVFGAIISISKVQPVVTLAAGCIAIVSGLFAIRYYYLASKKIKNE